jgi:hypothetical protein
MLRTSLEQTILAVKRFIKVETFDWESDRSPQVTIDLKGVDFIAAHSAST